MKSLVLSVLLSMLWACGVQHTVMETAEPPTEPIPAAIPKHDQYNDRCPDEPEVIDEFVDDGCPELDSDQDGILDSQDKCPNQAEDMDGFEDEDGCPDFDNDQDGIPDVNDHCPLLAETINGLDDDDGCPERRSVANPMRYSAVPNMHFPVWSADIEPRSMELLRDMATFINNESRIAVLRIHGHAAVAGTKSLQENLSKQRAIAVRDALVALGVDPTRLKTSWYGATKPRATRGPTTKDHPQNSRVEFEIVQSH